MSKAENLQKIIELRHALHSHPELSLCEKETISRLKGFLEENTSLEITDRGGWFYAVKPGKNAGAVAFRADMDALPIDEGETVRNRCGYASQTAGVSHKCGHDGHMAALCGLALELEDRTPDRAVYLIFQPAEETGQGARMCAGLIREKGIQEIYAFHNLGGFPEREIVYRRGLSQPASEGLTIRLDGKPSHASAPEDGINPSPAIASLALYAGETTEPEKSKRMALCTIVGMGSGHDDFGIAAGDGHICFTLRAEEEAVMKEMEERLLSRAGELASGYGLDFSYTVSDRFPETRNHDRAMERVCRAAEEAGLSVTEMGEIWRASEDFGLYLKECEGAIFYIGNGESYPALHTENYDFNDRILETAVTMFCRLAGI